MSKTNGYNIKSAKKKRWHLKNALYILNAILILTAIALNIKNIFGI